MPPYAFSRVLEVRNGECAVNKKLTAELDVESYFADTFTPYEQQFVESCAAVLATYSLTHTEQQRDHQMAISWLSSAASLFDMRAAGF
jgi:hypothetical protein